MITFLHFKNKFLKVRLESLARLEFQVKLDLRVKMVLTEKKEALDQLELPDLRDSRVQEANLVSMETLAHRDLRDST